MVQNLQLHICRNTDFTGRNKRGLKDVYPFFGSEFINDGNFQLSFFLPSLKLWSRESLGNEAGKKQ